MTVIPLYEVGQPFYVPAFEVLLRGAPMPRNVVRDVVEVTYQDSIDKVDSFTLVLNNWDADRLKPKFLGAGNGDDSLFNLVQPGNEIQLLMGYEGRTPDLRVMTTGCITALDADFPEAASPKLTVRGLNVLDQLRGKQYTWRWPDDGRETVTDSAIAKLLSGPANESSGKPGLGIKVRVNDEAADREPLLPYVMMNNQYPIVFLMERARRNGYDVFLTSDPSADPRDPPIPILYFGPSERVPDRTYKLEWGRSLVSFKPVVSTTRQVKKVTVLGWDRSRKKQIKGEAVVGDSALNRDWHDLIRANGREEVVTDTPVATEAEANAVATKVLDTQLQELVEGTGVVVGLPDLRAGRVIEIQGFNPRLNGRWFLKETTHVINDSGYRTTFVARRERDRM